ncbi:hypothetical protein IF1G_03360 [Cordyceps javanica]|uniref:Uncharacterized protein n=1 Tax=Cordyceps javanica TaxID=43265 RepID=A0A545V7C8_9HYPO|nr:hypothetical protein IF1G_03360 [Cordyceps javanica]
MTTQRQMGFGYGQVLDCVKGVRVAHGVHPAHNRIDHVLVRSDLFNQSEEQSLIGIGIPAAGGLLGHDEKGVGLGRYGGRYSNSPQTEGVA